MTSACQLERVLTDRGLAARLSKKIRVIVTERRAPEKVVLRQLEIYRQVITESWEGNS